VLGCSRPEHVLENIARLQVPVPPALWEDLAAEGMIER
jgi:hypothetical protein